MMSSLKKIVASAAALCALALAPAAHAGLITFDIKWSNDSGVPIAVAELTLESSLIKVSSYADSISIDQIESLNVTVSGAGVGNGTFTKADFSGISFYTASAMDFKKELIGQTVKVPVGPFEFDTPYGYTPETGAFNLFAIAPTTPTTVRPFAIATDRTGEISDYLVVSSIMARSAVTAVPEPETYALMLAGLSLTLLRARRKK